MAWECEDEEECRNRWKTYFRLRVAFTALILIPFVFVFGLGGMGRNVVLVLGGIWVGGLFIVTPWYGFWHCPRCGRPFNTGWLLRPYRISCAHCDLRTGACSNEEDLD